MEDFSPPLPSPESPAGLPDLAVDTVGLNNVSNRAISGFVGCNNGDSPSSELTRSTQSSNISDRDRAGLSNSPETVVSSRSSPRSLNWHLMVSESRRRHQLRDVDVSVASTSSDTSEPPVTRQLSSVDSSLVLSPSICDAPSCVTLTTSLASPDGFVGPSIPASSVSTASPPTQMVHTTADASSSVTEAPSVQMGDSVEPADTNLVPFTSPSDSADLSDSPKVDLALTQLKLHQLQQDVLQLDKAIQANRTSFRNLDDWFIGQMTAISVGVTHPSRADSSEPNLLSETEIKHIFEERTRILKQQFKALSEQYQATLYIIEQFRSHGIPLGTSPKHYVRHLLKQRGSALTPGKPMNPVAQPYSPRAQSPVTLHHPVDTSHDETRGTSTTGLQSTSLTSVAETGRNAKTLPTGSTVNPVTPFRRQASHPDLVTSVSQADATPSISLHLEGPDPTNLSPGQIMNQLTLTDLDQPTGTKCLISHATSPDFATSFYGNGDGTRDSFPAALIPSPRYGIMKQPKGVFQSVRQGFEHLGRQFRLAHRGRSASEENFLIGTKDGDNATDIFIENQPTKSISRTRGKSTWPSNFAKKSKKDASHLHFPLELGHSHPLDTGVGVKHTHGLVPGTSRSGSVYSYTGVPVSHFSIPPQHPSSSDQRSRGFGASSGSTPCRNEQTTNHAVPSTGGSFAAPGSTAPDVIDQNLTRVLDLLTVNMSACTGIGGANRTPSSSSSLSVSGPGGRSLSTGQKSMITVPTTSTTNITTSVVATGTSDTHPSVSYPISSSVVPTTYSFAPIATGNVALALTALYQLTNAQTASIMSQQTESMQLIRMELAALRRENFELQESVVKLTAELESHIRDAQTRERLQKEKLENVTAWIVKLDAVAEGTVPDLQADVANLRNDLRVGLETLDYQLNSRTRVLTDNIATITNKVSIMEKPSDQHSASGHNGSELARIRDKVLHCLTDLCVSLFALLTMLLQVLIRCLNLGAVITENRTIAITFSILLATAFILAYISDPLISQLSNAPVGDPTNFSTTNSSWRDTVITILSIFRRLSRVSR